MLSLPRHVPFLVLAVALAAATTVTPVFAQEARREGRAELGMRLAEPRMQGQAEDSPRRISSLSDSVRRVQRETGGRILGAERVPYDGRDINRVKYMDERGRVRYMDDVARPSREREPQPQGRDERPPRGDNP